MKNNIKCFRIAKDLSQQELADKIGISVYTLSRYETGRREPRLPELKKIAEIFGCTIDEVANPILASPASTKVCS